MREILGFFCVAFATLILGVRGRPTPFISDNDIDVGSGLFNVIIPAEALLSALPFNSFLQAEDNDPDSDRDEYEQVTIMHNGRRGWGYSVKMEGKHTKY